MSIRLLTIPTLALALALSTAPAALADESYVTIMFSRAQVQAVTPNCTPLPGGVTIWQVADDLAAKGYAATEAASPSYEVPTGEACVNGSLVLGWQDLRTMHSSYGWDVIPRGNRDDRSLSPSQQWDDSCGLLPTFYDNGFPDAWAMYAYFGGPYSATMQSDVVATCFSFGRTYREGPNPLPVPSPYLVKVFSINGGNCADTTLPCHTGSAPYGYTQPSTLQALVQSAGWDIIQGYKFVTGSYSSSFVSWDCTGADPASHWSTRSEFYCYSDWQSVIDAIPPTTPVVSPSFMAALQNRTMAKGALASITVTPSTSTIVAGGTQPYRVEGFDAAGHDLGDVTSASTLAIDQGGSCTNASCEADAVGVYTVTATNGAATAAAQLNVVDPPTVSGIAPAAAPVGASVAITGTGLDRVSGVSFNGTRASFTIVSPGQLTATVPSGATSGQVVMTALGGVHVQAGSFGVQPKITGFSPLSAPAGASVTITGSAFVGATNVTVAGVPAAFTVNSYSSITATVPVVSAPGPITVTTPDGTATSAASFGTGFAVTGFSPTSGRVGATVTITGTGLGAATAVLFNGGGATFKVVSATSLTAVVPLSGSTGKIAVKAGTVTARSATNFLVIPVVTSFSPTSGRAGTVVDIRGSGFVNATAVLFGGVAASTYTVVSGGEIKATVPSGALSGKITVRTAGGSAKSTGNFTVLKGARAAPAHR